MLTGKRLLAPLPPALDNTAHGDSVVPMDSDI